MSFTWNSITSDTLGLIVEKYPNRPIPSRKIAAYQIAGRDGDLLVDYGSYTNVIQEYEVFVKETSGNTLQENITTIANWLIGTAGYQTLTDSYDTNIYRDARVENASEFVNSLNRFGRGTIRFDCKPQRWETSPLSLSGIIGDTFSFSLLDAGLQKGYPLITITTIGANCSFKVEDSNGLRIVVPARGSAIAKIEIDWQNQTVLNKYNDTLPSNTSVSGAWKPLGLGDSITTTLDTGTAPSVSIAPRGFYL